MNDREPYKSHKNIFDLIEEEINKITRKRTMKRQLEYPIKELEDLLDKMHKNVGEIYNLPEIEGSITVIHFYKRDNKPMWEYRIGTYIKSIGNVIGCFSNSQRSPYKIECVNYSDIESELFELFGLPQSISFIEDIKYTILNMFNILNPGVLTDMDKQYIHIETQVWYSNKPKKENPEIYIYNNNEVLYDDNRYKIDMTWYFDGSSKL